MKTASFRATASAAIAAASASLLVVGQLVSCGGDDATNAAPSDASSMDSTTVGDGSPVPVDGALDGAPEGDADASAVTTPDADAGLGMLVDAADGSDGAFSCPIALPTESEFYAGVADAVCQSVKACCNTGASFDTPGCLSIYGNAKFGGFFGVGAPVAFLDGGRIGYDPVAACQCLQAVGALGCGLLSSDDISSIQAVCLTALHGTVPFPTDFDAGDGGDSGDAAVAAPPGCASTYECASGSCTTNYASTPAAGASLGICVPLAGDGGACSTQNQCSELGNGTPAQYCTGTTCAPRLIAGSACTGNAQCASNLCEQAPDASTLSCVSGLVFTTQAACAFFTLPDAGADGG